MPNRLRSFIYRQRPKWKRGRKSARYPFISFQYLQGGEVDKQLTLIQDYLVIKSRSHAARQAVYIASRSMTVDSAHRMLENLVTEPNPREWLRVEAIPDTPSLKDALGAIKRLVAEAKNIRASDITNKLAYEVSIAYVADRVEKYAQQDAQE